SRSRPGPPTRCARRSAATRRARIATATTRRARWRSAGFRVSRATATGRTRRSACRIRSGPRSAGRASGPGWGPGGAAAAGGGPPRVELVRATSVDDGAACGQILANLGFHLADTGFFPEPGVMVRDVIGALGDGDLSQRLPHVYITVPRSGGLALPIDEGPPP